MSDLDFMNNRSRVSPRLSSPRNSYSALTLYRQSKFIAFLLVLINAIFLYYSFLYIASPEKVPQIFIYVVMFIVGLSSLMSVIFGTMILFKRE